MYGWFIRKQKTPEGTPVVKYRDYPRKWRMRAEEIRVLAEDMEDAEAKSIMLRMADDYDRRAEHAEELAKGTHGAEHH
jgi:hypothetical protein